MFQSLTQLLPCRYCRDSYTSFYGTLGPPQTGHAAQWIKSMHTLVNKKLFGQRMETFLEAKNFSSVIAAELRSSADVLLPEPTMEVLQKKFMVNREEPIVWRNVSTFLLAFYMCLLMLQDSGAAKEAMRNFLVALITVLKISGQGNASLLVKIMEDIQRLEAQESIAILEKIKYESIVGPSGPLKSASDATRLIKAGQCINGSCV